MPMATTIRPMMNGAMLAPGGVLAASVIARMRNSRMAVPMTWSRSAPHSLTGNVPFPGRVEKTPWVLMVRPGSAACSASV
jgi:hypothetical protein